MLFNLSFLFKKIHLSRVIRPAARSLLPLLSSHPRPGAAPGSTGLGDRHRLSLPPFFRRETLPFVSLLSVCSPPSRAPSAPPSRLHPHRNRRPLPICLVALYHPPPPSLRRPHSALTLSFSQGAGAGAARVGREEGIRGTNISFPTDC